MERITSPNSGSNTRHRGARVSEAQIALDPCCLVFEDEHKVPPTSTTRPEPEAPDRSDRGDRPAARSSVDKLLGLFQDNTKQKQQAKARQNPRRETSEVAIVAHSHRTIPYKSIEDIKNADDTSNTADQHRWLAGPRETMSTQQAAAARERLRPPALGPKDITEKQFGITDQLWSKIFGLIPGATSRTAAIVARHDPEKGKEILRRVLRNKNARGMATHTRNVLGFYAWHALRWPKLPWLPVDGEPSTRALHAAVLVDFLEDLMDADVSPGVPRSKLTSLNVAQDLCKPTYGWPTKEPIVVNLTQTYFREGKHKKRAVRLYTVEEIKMIERALSSAEGPAPGPLERIVLATELRKLYARLRQDDSTWGSAAKWRLVETKDDRGDPVTHWHGEATKAKGTEMRANWVHETMPWIAPVRGLLEEPSNWYNQVYQDMHTLGMNVEDEYLLPSPPAVRAGRRPPGAAQPLEWINLLRRTLVKIGFEPNQAATVCGHTAKRIMLTWMNASGYVRLDQGQQAAGYHRARGPGSVSRRYTFQEQSGPVRIIDQVCRSIREGEYFPDNPIGAQWDASYIQHTPSWQDHRHPTQPTLGQQTTEQQWSSDDEAPPDGNPLLHMEHTAEDLPDIPAPGMKGVKQQKQTRGYIYSTTNHQQKKRNRYHIAVIYDEIPEHIRGCADKNRRAHVTSHGRTLHVLCDSRIANPKHNNTARKPRQQDQSLCSICSSRRKRWFHHLAAATDQPAHSAPPGSHGVESLAPTEYKAPPPTASAPPRRPAARKRRNEQRE